MQIFLDSNVFLYAAGAEHPLREPCQAVLRQLAEGKLSAITSVEVIQELLYVLSRRRRTADGVRLSRNVLALFPNLLPVSRQDMALACDLVEKYPSISTRDAVHAATMLNNGLQTLISADQHFDAMEGIRRVEPAVAAR